MKSKSIAGLLSLFVPGLGQFFNSQTKKGIIFILTYLIFLVVISQTPVLLNFLLAIIFISSLVFFRVFVVIDAILKAKEKDSQRKAPLNKWYYYLAIVIVYFALSNTITSYGNQAESFKMVEQTMEPTIKSGDFIIADLKLDPEKEVKRNDILLFNPPNDPKNIFIQRCVAIAGDTVLIHGGQLFINSEEIQDSVYTTRSVHDVLSPNVKMEGIFPKEFNNIDNYGPVVIPEDQYFFLGDNRDNSFDSRFFGFVPVKNIVGKPKYIWLSFSPENNLPRFERISLNLN